MIFSEDECGRYSRHFSLNKVGISGQEKLKNAQILIVGLGGIGSPASLYLSAAGIGTLGLADDDTVSLSNLHRQVLYPTDTLGKAKIDIAARELIARNPNTHIHCHSDGITEDNVLALFEQYDLILDGSDNFKTRYLCNWAAARLHKPLVSASIDQFQGQLGLYHTPHTPCYACVFPAPPPSELVPNCAEAGVIGTLPGIMGTLAANRIINFLLNLTPTQGTLLHFDALESKIAEYKTTHRIECRVCKGTETLEAMMKYNPKAPPEVPEISSHALQDLLVTQHDFDLVDVREEWERDICDIDGSISIPLGTLTDHLTDLHDDREIVVYCRSGGRSACATAILIDNGFSNVRNLTGGMLKWIDDIDPSQKKY